MITVMKFGGTSVGSPEALRRVSDIICSHDGGRVAVVSAMSGVTNLLISTIHDADADLDDVVSSLRDRHMSAASELFTDEVMESYSDEFDGMMSNLRTLLSRRMEVEDSPHIYDAISCFGERLSSLTVSCTLRSIGVRSEPVCSEDAGIVAVGPPRFGSAELEATSVNLKGRLLPSIEDGVVPVLTGFYGMGPGGRPLTFGRGGSDYSASVVAYALDADLLEIWTDVDGFMTADPRIVPDASTIAEMNYWEAADLAYFGAKVLHPRTIEPVRRKGIPVRVANTFNHGGTGTMIRRLRCRSDALLRSVAMMRDLSIVKVYAPEVAYRLNLVSRIIDVIGRLGVSTYAISSSLSTIAFVVPSAEAGGVEEGILVDCGDDIERISIEGRMSLVCAVGDGLIDVCGASRMIFSAVEDAGANVELISEGASDVALNFAVPQDRGEAVIRMLHEQFIGV